MMRCLLAASVLSVLSTTWAAKLPARIGETVHATCDYSSSALEFGDMVSWKKVHANDPSKTYSISVLGRVMDEWKDYYAVNFSRTASVLSIRVESNNQTGTYHCEVTAKEQIIQAAVVQLDVYAGVKDFYWSGNEGNSVKVITSHPSPINFTMTSYIYVANFITVNAGLKDLTTETRCEMTSNAQDTRLVLTVCSTRTTTITQNDNTVLFTVSIDVPLFEKRQEDKLLLVLIPPEVDCPGPTPAAVGFPVELSCAVLSAERPVTFLWKLPNNVVGSIDSSLEEQWIANGTISIRGTPVEGRRTRITLSFVNVKEADYGQYWLTATNEGGSHSDDVILEKPKEDADAGNRKPVVASERRPVGGVTRVRSSYAVWSAAAAAVALATASLATGSAAFSS